MDNIDLFRKAASALEQGRPVALVTVIATTGSTPGKVGYKMLVFGDGEGIAGTVGGGLLEAKMIEEAGRMLDEPRVRLFRFDLDGTAGRREGNLRRRSVEFLIETFDTTSLPLFRELSAVGSDKEGGVLVSILSPEGLPRKMWLRDVEHADIAGLSFPEEIMETLREVAASGGAGTKVSAGSMDVFVESLAVQPTVVLFGAGHVSYHIARFARADALRRGRL